jgi:hypothetical protein
MKTFASLCVPVADRAADPAPAGDRAAGKLAFTTLH